MDAAKNAIDGAIEKGQGLAEDVKITIANAKADCSVLSGDAKKTCEAALKNGGIMPQVTNEK